ncbi:MAG: PD40 domain-containing protein [Deltaproteobacteria bacterium]|nr:PD40 domain-containing protein [Deltaproteobacteria bacterium]
MGLGLTALVSGLAPSEAQAGFVFEYNYPDLDWYTIETDHFYVHYPVSKVEEGNDHYLNAEYSARRAAEASEEMFEPVCSNFNYYLTEKIHVVLVNQTDYLEGFTVPPWDWIVISANPGSYFYRMRGRMEWFSDVLVHEFGHVISLKLDAYNAEGTQGVLLSTLYQDGIHDTASGAEVFLGGAEPFWWTEGVTEYSSDEAGYNWWSNSREQNIRMTFLDERLLSYDELIIAFDKNQWGDGERNYQQGYSLNAYIRERFGDKATFEMARKGGEKWRPNWHVVVEEVTGVRMEQIYDDWKAYNSARYQAEWDEVRAEGEVIGREMTSSVGDWEYSDPDGKDKWYSKKQEDRETARERTGTWYFYAKYSQDGKWYAENATGALKVSEQPERLVGALQDEFAGSEAAATKQRKSDMSFWIPNEFGHTYDFVPGKDEIVFTGNEHLMGSPYVSGGRVELDGYEWKAIYIADLSPTTKEKRKDRGEKVAYETLKPNKILGKRWDRDRYTIVPNTLRGHDPAVSPDGTKIAFLQYEDGADNLAIINFDGTEKTLLTDFRNSFVQNIDWSPDGTQLVFSLFKDQRQDLYIMNADGTDMRAINRDPWEDQDAHWAQDGNIYFSSDPDGKFNIFRYEPEANKVVQITNVIGGAQIPSITPAGDLLYTYYTGNGFKDYALPQAEFFEKDVSNLFGLDVDQTEVQEFLAYTQDLSKYEAVTTPYNFARAIMPPTAVPIIKFENDTMTNFGLTPGFQVFTQDYVGDHTAFLVGQTGEDPLLLGSYTYAGWYPTIDLMAYHYQAKFDYGYLIDDDNDLETTDDQSVYEGKQHQFVNIGMVGINYPLNGRVNLGLSSRIYQYGFKTSSDTTFQPYMYGTETSLDFTYNTVRARYGHMNAHGGRYLQASLGHGFTDMVYAGYNGFDSDDGQLLDKYHYNRAQVNWTEHIPLGGFGLDALDFMTKRPHTFEWTFQAGAIDRNVQYQDEFRAGGVHPAYMGTGAIQPNNQFSGYPAFSLSGETMLVASAGYRFPIITDIDRRWGAFYLYDIHAQVGGTAGNLWSFRPPEEDDTSAYYYDNYGQRVAYDPSSVRREIPFIDKAYKNNNWMLFDTMAEVRVSSALMTASWSSFFRVSYAFNEITGIQDPNGDDISETTDTGFGNSLSAETEKPGPRFYLGIGTGW